MPSITQMYEWAVAKCNAPNVGYSTEYRNQQTVDGITYYDCSSFVWYACIAGGFSLSGYPFTTHTMGSILEGVGFKRLSPTDEWKNSDIVVRNNAYGEHTEIVFDANNLYTMGAHSDSLPLDEQVSIDRFTHIKSSWDDLYRYEGGDTPTEIKSSAYVVASICGCFKRESGVNPGIWESLIPCEWDFQYDYTHKGGYGLGQWTNVGTPHGRCYQLHEWVTSNGYEDGDGDGQLAFLIHENVWYNKSDTRGNYKTLQEFLNSDSQNLNDLVWDFLSNWEGVSGDAYSERLEAAQAFLKFIQENADKPSSEWEWTSNNDYMGFKSQEQYANVMKVYWFLNGYSPTPKPTRKKSKWIYMLKNRNNFY